MEVVAWTPKGDRASVVESTRTQAEPVHRTATEAMCSKVAMIESLVDWSQIERASPSSARQMSDPEVIGDRQRYAEVGPRVPPAGAGGEAGRGVAPRDATTPRARASCSPRARTPSCARCSRPPRARDRGARGGDPPRDGRARSQRRQERHRRDPGRRRRRGGRAVGRRPLPDAHAATPSAAASRPSRWTSARASTRSRSRATARTRSSSSRAARTASSASRPPSRRAASTPRPRRSRCCPRPRTSTSTIDPNDLQIDVYRSGGPGRPVGQHDRLGGAHHAQADRASSSRCRTRRASCRTARRRCASCARGSTSARWPSSRPSSPPTAARRSARATAPRRSAPTTTASAASPTTASSSPPTTSTRCSRASSTSSPPRCRPTRSAAASRPRRPTPDAAWRSAAAPASREALDSARRRDRRARGVDTPRLDAELLLAHALGVDRTRAVRWIPTAPVDGAGGRARSATLVRRRTVEREPVAYLVGRKRLSPHRPDGRPRACSSRGPETEHARRGRLLDAAARARASHDVGTGSGAIALALKHERPDLASAASDVSRRRARGRARQRASGSGSTSRSSRRDLLDGVDRRRSTSSSPTRPTSRDGDRARCRPRSCATSRRSRSSPAPTASTSIRPLVPAGRAPRRAAGARGRRRPGAGGRAALRRAPRASRRSRRVADLAGIERVVRGRAGDRRATRPATFERCMAVGGVARLPRRHGLRPGLRSRRRATRSSGCTRSRAAGRTSRRRSCSSRSSSRSPRCPSSARGRARRCEALLPGAGDAAAAQPGAPLPAGLRRRTRTTLGLRVPALGAATAALGAVRWPVLQSSANLAGGADARRLADVPAAIRDGADLVARRRRAARHAVDGRRPAALRARRARWSDASARAPWPRSTLAGCRSDRAWHRSVAALAVHWRDMVIAIGSDHAGYHLKEHVKRVLAAAGHDVVDVGTETPDSVDYPRLRRAARRAWSPTARPSARVLACGSGVGVAIVANKVAGVRAVNAHDPAEVEMARRHNDANVVTLSGARLHADAGRRDRRALPARPASRAAATRAASARSRARRLDRPPARRGCTVGASRLAPREEATSGERHHVLPRAWASIGPKGAAACSDLSPDFFNRPLADVDPEVADALAHRARPPAAHAGDDRLARTSSPRRSSRRRAAC